MTPREKAIELVSLFGNIVLGECENGEPYLMAKESLREAKQCALISVDELLFTLNETSEEDNSTYAYHTAVFYNQVKTELKLL